MENFPRPVHLLQPADLSRKQAFLCSIAPFQALPQSEIATMAANLKTEVHPAEQTLLVQEETVVTHVLIVASGRLERTIQSNGQVRVHEILGVGRIYGGISILFNNGISTSSLRTLETSTVHHLDRENFFRLCAKHPAFAAHFKTSLKEEDKRLTPATAPGTLDGTDYDARGTFLSKAVSEVARAFPACLRTAPVRQAAELMTTGRQSAIMVADDNHRPLGIITDYDLRKKVVADGRSPDTPAEAVMSAPLITVSGDTPIFEAMITMMRHQVKHLGVLRGERIEAMITERELFLARTPSPIILTHAIHTAPGLEAIKDGYGRLPQLIDQLIVGGAKADHLNGIITAFTDAALTRIMEMALEALGPPPAPFAFLLFGSEGRREQTLKTDQDNAIVYADISADKADRVHAYFLELGTRVCDDLNTIGQAYCENDIMAKNPQWCRPLHDWKEYYRRWVESDDPERLLNANIFFDFRLGHGETRLVNALHAALFDQLSEYSGFLRHMARNTLHFRPPLGFFGNFVLEEKGERKGGLDIKSAMRLVVDFARIYAMQERIRETGTIKRLGLLREKDVLEGKDHDELVHAYEHLMLQRLKHQARRITRAGAAPDNYLRPAEMTQIEQQSLKEAFKCIRIAQAKMRLDFFLNFP